MTPDRVPFKYCRYCGRIIPMDVVNCPYCERNTIRVPGQKECPVCGEPIRQKAIKCKHCGEFLDGRPAEAPGQQVIYIDKAVIAQSDQAGGLRIQETPPGQRGQLGAEGGAALLGEGAEAAEAPAETSGTLPGGVERKALPPGETSGLPAVPGKGPLPDRVRAAPPVVPAKPKKGKKEEERKAPQAEPPAARYQCPSCERYVYEGDNFCENCGRDLSIPAGQREFPGPRARYQPADYALMVGAAAPLGLLLGPSVAMGIAAVGALLGGWCLFRTVGSRGRLMGTSRAVGAVAAAAFWFVMIAAFA